MLINLSNHPYSKWSQKQKQAAEEQFEQVIDVQFPAIPTEADLDQVIEIAEAYVAKCFNLLMELQSPPEKAVDKIVKDAIHIMGEMTFVYQFVKKMSEQGILCIASTTERVVVEDSEGTKISKFEFVRFRPYTNDLF